MSAGYEADYQGQALALPEVVREVFDRFLVADLTTVTGDGTAVTWPVLPIFEAKTARFALVTSIGLPAKAHNIRRRPHVSLLYADPLGSDLVDPPRVLVQGRATAEDRVLVSIDQVEDQFLVPVMKEAAVRLAKRQPNLGLYLSNPLSRYLMDWYFMRILILIQPKRIAWGRGDPSGWEVLDVG